jgi:hypothetical protein
MDKEGQFKNPMTSLGIETATFRLVAECCNEGINAVEEGSKIYW